MKHLLVAPVADVALRSRKRRSSPNSSTGNGTADVIMDEDEDSDVMDECAAAMVLMRLSCSPHSPRWEGTPSPPINPDFVLI